jgi:hypothetical protein
MITPEHPRYRFAWAMRRIPPGVTILALSPAV